MALTNRQQLFVVEYLKCWNASEAARRAGYNGRANTVGPRLLANVVIAAEIKARITEKAMGADEVLIRLAEQARADMADFLEFKDGVKRPYLDLKGAQERGLLRLVKKFKYNSEGQPEIELYDAQAAMVHLGKHHGLFVDEHRVTVTVEKELNRALDKLQQGLDADTYATVLRILASGQAGEGQAGEDSANDPIE